MKNIFILTVLIFTSIITFSMLSSRLSVPDNVISWLNTYYTKFPVGGGWVLEKVVDDRGRARIDFKIPRALGGNYTQQQNMLKAMCPNRHEEIWKNQFANEIEIFVMTNDGKFSAIATCPSFNNT